MDWASSINWTGNITGNPITQEVQQLPAIDLTDPNVLVTTWSDFSTIVLVIGLFCIIIGHLTGWHHGRNKKQQ